MFVVALAEVRHKTEEEIAALAAILGAPLLEVRMWTGGVLPHVVFRSESSDPAYALVGKLRARGHAAFACAASDAAPIGSFVRGHRIRFEDAAFVPHQGAADRIAFDDIEILLHLVVRTDVLRTTRERVVVRVGARAVATELEDVSHHEQLSGRSILIFARGVRPCVLHEGELQYLGLGPAMRATSRENFNLTLSMLRARAPAAVFDERFALTPLNGADAGPVRDHDTPAVRGSGRQVDLSVHLLMLWLRSLGGDPYRSQPPRVDADR